MGIINKFNIDYFYSNFTKEDLSSFVKPKLSLDTNILFDNELKSGWTINAHINFIDNGSYDTDYGDHIDCGSIDYVGDFKATHPQYGLLYGNFESEIYADSEETFQQFLKDHKPIVYDIDPFDMGYWDK